MNNDKELYSIVSFTTEEDLKKFIEQLDQAVPESILKWLRD